MKTHSISHQMCHRRNPPLHWTVKYYQDLRQAILLDICSCRCSGSCLHLHAVSLLIGWWAPTAGVCVLLLHQARVSGRQNAPCGEHLSLQGTLGECFSNADWYDGNVCDRCTATWGPRDDGCRNALCHCYNTSGVFTALDSLSLSQEMQTLCYHSYFHVECRERVWGDLLCSLSRHIWMLGHLFIYTSRVQTIPQRADVAAAPQTWLIYSTDLSLQTVDWSNCVLLTGWNKNLQPQGRLWNSLVRQKLDVTWEARLQSYNSHFFIH